MAKHIANQTLHGKETIRERDPKVPTDRGEYRDHVVAPGGEFEPSDLGIGADELKGLIAAGAVRLKTREVPDDDAPASKPVAENTAQRGPASGATAAPDSEAVAKQAAEADGDDKRASRRTGK
jgi:hypothetical protein